MDEVAILDGEIALCEQRIQSLNSEIERLDKAVQRSERRKKFWKVVAISEGGILLLVVGGVLLAL
jgi:hypothetical protein